MTGDFQRNSPKETAGKALMQAICKKLQEPGGRVHAGDLITTLASITGELAMDATGLFSSRSQPLTPGQPIFSDAINAVMFGDVVGLETIPAESVVGILRDRLCAAGYRPGDFPDLKTEVLEHFVANATKNLGNRAPLSIPAEHMPRVHSMAVGYEARPIVDRLFAPLGSDAKTRMRAAAHALAEALVAVKDVLPHRVALLIALQTLNATTKKAPMTDSAMERFKKGQVPPPPPMATTP